MSSACDSILRTGRHTSICLKRGRDGHAVNAPQLKCNRAISTRGALRPIPAWRPRRVYEVRSGHAACINFLSAPLDHAPATRYQYRRFTWDGSPPT
jgi:hypothetical protein